VFGCGGNRDAGKRPLMGAIAGALAQQVVVTSDNPRREKPAAILAAITAGITSNAAVTVIEDRQAAIAHAVAHAAPADVVLIAGKGHETDQDIDGVKHPFSDVDEALAALSARCSQHAVEACA
jgi:UDP-N-acetylmuramoyl-L-alanyl-D-glutamate--2,6-diaminopimelate ligase